MRNLCDKCKQYPKREGSSKFCYWCSLSRLPMVTQVEVADHRLARTARSEYRARVPATQWPAGERWCAGCQSCVPRFYCRGARCRACASRSHHEQQLAREFFMSPEEYLELLEYQGGVCAICLQKPVTRRLAVDHNHFTGARRGLLCSRCNNELLVLVNHDADMLRRAADYLENPPWKEMKAKATTGSPDTPTPTIKS